MKKLEERSKFGRTGKGEIPNYRVRNCSEIAGCPPEKRSKCAVYLENRSCWFTPGKCQCLASQNRICITCPTYQKHKAELKGLDIGNAKWDKGNFNAFFEHLRPMFSQFLPEETRNLPITTRKMRILEDVAISVIRRGRTPVDVPMEQYLFRIYNEIFG